MTNHHIQKMKNISTLLLGAIIFCSSESYCAELTCETVPASMKTYISSYASKVNGDGHCDSVISGTLNNNNLTIVLFIVEGSCGEGKLEPGSFPGACGNHYEGYMFAGFNNATQFSEPFAFPAQYSSPTAWFGGFNASQIKNNSVIVSISQFVENDYHATPTGKRDLIFKLINKQFEMQNQQ
jgi:hypothetical protein